MWVRHEPPLLINDLTVLRSYCLCFSLAYPLQFGARDQDCVPAEHAGRWMMLGQRQGNTDSIRSIPNFFQQNEPMISVKTALRGNPLRSDGVDRTGDTSQTRVSATRKTTVRGGQMMVGWNRTHLPRITYSQRVVDAEQEVGQP